MDKREVAGIFRQRLKDILAAHSEGKTALLRQAGIDRSALSQFLSADKVRLPRAEALRRLAVASGVSVDWLLAIENAPEGRQEVSSSMQIEQAMLADESSPLARWHAEAQGTKLRYVPSTLPDMLSLTDEQSDSPRPAIYTRGGGVENILGEISLQDMDVEIAMPIQTLQDVAAQSGLWRTISAARCRRQLEHMSRICEERYPSLRLHLYDGSKSYSAPFTVFGQLRVAVYIGEAYLVITGQEQVRYFTQRFDRLVRAALVSPDRVHRRIRELVAKG
ncbi:MAG: helix-turn-helix domain-containing protein [Hyphomicrobiaceae bacterium]